ncbi:hypothetical protein F4553_002739 [Allocatelliglobosispora scoriae]|uniref:Uncharacterized protein n=1 Tax=Allocatelliglobosispora scoriae TaxID=643052 RepID=A0A841BRC6_9ACTN|nr:hypothetical protein [Allocatelliglobosispora scoriae]MBB5869360.1 hypothetical protein [Allocatelliglobosispora scoriae]
MIVASLLLIAVAIGLLVLGLANGSSGLLVGSIGTSLLAAVALVVGARQATSARAEADLLDIEDERAESDDYEEPRERRGSARGAEPLIEPEPLSQRRQDRNDRAERSDTATVVIPAQGTSAAPEDIDDEEDPPDEPIPQRVQPADAARIARMATDVLVIDGRPRYHVAGCVHLLGRPHEPLPVGEAVELGFTPCGLCEPDSALLADARRV